MKGKGCQAGRGGNHFLNESQIVLKFELTENAKNDLNKGQMELFEFVNC